jgi:homoserine kinase type II
MIDFTKFDLARYWPVDPPARIEPIEGGFNNRSYLVQTGSRSYVLKLYQNAGMDVRLRFEHELLRTLDGAGLPFAVPAPMVSRSGTTTVEHDGGLGLVALFHRIPGLAAERGNAEVAARCGQALGVLDVALAQISLDPAIAVPRAVGSLADEHPTVPDITASVNRIFRDRVEARALISVLERAEREWMRATAGWPHQIIHVDLFPSNVLVEGGEVSGILDFEFAGMSHRAMDFTVGLVAFSSMNRDDGVSWSMLEAFAKGYLRELPLAEPELAAVPALVLMREAGSFVHWLGRMEQGLTTRHDVHERADRILALDTWLEGNGAELVDRLGKCLDQPSR